MGHGQVGSILRPFQNRTDQFSLIYYRTKSPEIGSKTEPNQTKQSSVSSVQFRTR